LPHAHLPRGGFPPPRERGHDPTPGPDRARRDRRSAAPARRQDARAPAVLRARHRGPPEPPGRFRRGGRSALRRRRPAVMYVREYGPAALVLLPRFLASAAALYPL